MGDLGPEDALGRRSTDISLAVLGEHLQVIAQQVTAVLEQTRQTNGRVTELEVKERIRNDREEQKAIRLAASEAAKYRVEQQAAEDLENRQGVWAQKRTWWLMLLCAAIGSGPAIVALLLAS